jgi:hypothetical protein
MFAHFLFFASVHALAVGRRLGRECIRGRIFPGRGGGHAVGAVITERIDLCAIQHDDDLSGEFGLCRERAGVQVRIAARDGTAGFHAV